MERGEQGSHSELARVDSLGVHPWQESSNVANDVVCSLVDPDAVLELKAALESCIVRLAIQKGGATARRLREAKQTILKEMEALKPPTAGHALPSLFCSPA